MIDDLRVSSLKPDLQADQHKILMRGLNLMRSTGVRPKLVLHVCCAPCSSYPLQLLAKYFEVKVVFNNPNIYPRQEFVRRYKELIDYVTKLYRTKKELAQHIQIIGAMEDVYDRQNTDINKCLSPFGDEPEGLNRCKECFKYRLSFAFEVARTYGCEYVMTTLTVGSKKNSATINEIALELNRELYPDLVYLPSDFKKDGGDVKTKDICDEYGIYRQKYCGCIYSFRETLKS